MPDHSKYSDIDYRAEFGDIAPYDDTQFRDKIQSLTREPGFEHAIRYVMPDSDFAAFCNNLLAMKSQRQFQAEAMYAFLQLLETKTTAGVTVSGIENIQDGKSYTFISNHRDIVLDASFLNLCLLRAQKPLTQIAIGSNLLIFDWITDLVKLNRSFIVKRNIPRLEALNAARQLSAYIHYTIVRTNESVWIAQREGRAKDSNDRTQESLVKMMALAGGGDARQNLEEINLLPVSISYEFDPNDYLKAREFLMRRRDPEFKKSQRDDLLSMETGILCNKGRVHFHIGACINPSLQQLTETDRNTVIRAACCAIDNSIHSNYMLFPINYAAYDELNGTQRFADKLSAEDLASVNAYIDSRIAKAKTEVSDVTPDEELFMRQVILTMYANPVVNWLDATSQL